MVQIGNFHIGQSDAAKKPTLSAGEAYTLWDNLVARYDWDDSLEMFYNYTYDPDLRKVIKKMMKLLGEQTSDIEKQLALFQIPLPPQPRKSIDFTVDSGVMKDDFIFRRMFSGMQDFLTVCAETLKHCVINDNLREMFIRLLFEKMQEFDELCTYGKKKGWLQVPPKVPIN